MISQAFLLETKRLILRPIRNSRSNALAYQQLKDSYACKQGDPEPRLRKKTGRNHRKDFREALEYAIDSENIWYGGFDKNNPDQVVLSLHAMSDDLTYKLDIQTLFRFRGQGYMSEALPVFLEFLDKDGIGPIEAEVADDNLASLGVIEKLGTMQEIESKHHDVRCFEYQHKL